MTTTEEQCAEFVAAVRVGWEKIMASCSWWAEPVVRWVNKVARRF